MKRTYQQIQGQIAKLRTDAEKLRQHEVADIVVRIKEAIAAYGLKASDLFGGASSSGARSPATRHSRGQSKASSKSKSRISTDAKFADGHGNEWVGRGPRPIWLREAIAAGKALSDFALGGGGKRASTSGAPRSAAHAKLPAGSKKASAASRKGKPVAIKYRDAEGNTWTGRGSQPRWLKAAIGAGKALEQFQV